MEPATTGTSMDPTTPTVLCIELRPLLKTANVTLCYTSDFLDRPNALAVGENAFDFTFFDVGGTTSRRRSSVDIPGVRFVPGSCSGFDCGAYGLSFRLELKDVSSPAPYRDKPESSLKSNVAYRGLCGFCKNDLLRGTVSFRRVLPMPPEWALGMVSEWFCHGGEEEEVGDLEGRLRPNAGECVVDVDHVVVHEDDLDFSRLRVCDARVSCKRCFQDLGETWTAAVDADADFAERQPVRLRKHSVQFHEATSERPAKRWTDLESGTSDNLWTLVFGRYDKACRVLIRPAAENEVTNDDVLLAWLMDDSVTHLVGHLHGESGTELKRFKKILYSLENEKSQSVRQWTNSPIEVLDLHRDLYLKLVDKLLTSTKTIPYSMRQVGAFWAAYV